MVPSEYVPWMRMKIDDLPPREYWATAQEDIELCSAIQQAVRTGEDRADAEARAEREREREKAERERKERAVQERLRSQMGR